MRSRVFDVADLRAQLLHVDPDCPDEDVRDHFDPEGPVTAFGAWVEAIEDGRVLDAVDLMDDDFVRYHGRHVIRSLPLTEHVVTPAERDVITESLVTARAAHPLFASFVDYQMRFWKKLFERIGVHSWAIASRLDRPEPNLVVMRLRPATELGHVVFQEPTADTPEIRAAVRHNGTRWRFVGFDRPRPGERDWTALDARSARN